MSEAYKNYYDIVILPPERIRNYSIKLSQKLYNKGAKWKLGEESFIPHISLYHIPVKPEDFSNFLNKAKNVVKGRKPKKLEITGVEAYEPHNAVMIATKRPKWLVDFHLEIVDETVEFVNWNYPLKESWRAGKLGREANENIEEYGSPFIGELFIPHITLGVFENKDDMKEAAKTLKDKKDSFEIDGVSICKLGENHSCQGVVEKVSFK